MLWALTGAHQLTHVSADAADWIGDVVTERFPTRPFRCADTFHVVGLGHRVRFDVEPASGLERCAGAGPLTNPNAIHRAAPRQNTPARPAHEHARQLEGARYALWKNPENLTDRQPPSWPGSPRPIRGCIAPICSKKGLRHVFSVKGEEGKKGPGNGGSSSARRCRIPVFVELAGRIVRHRQAIDAALEHGLSQGLIEVQANTKIRLLDPDRVRILLPHRH